MLIYYYNKDHLSLSIVYYINTEPPFNLPDPFKNGHFILIFHNLAFHSVPFTN